jgi:negative regulator of replication initiation
MTIIKIDDDKYVFVDGLTATVYSISDITQRISDIQSRIDDSPQPSDEELITWAKSNFPFIDHSEELKEIEKLTEILEKINGN